MEQSPPKHPNPEQLDPNDLLIFARVADAGSFTAAAEQLGLPKSSVSRRISLLEERLGERLMLRTTRRLTLTEFGEAMLEHGRALAEEVELARTLAESRRAQPSGRLRVSMPSDFANLLLGDLFAAFSALHPAVMLEIDLSPRRVDLLGERVDLAIRFGDLPDDSLLAARRLRRFTWGLYAAPDYLAEHGTPRSPEDLKQHRCLRLLDEGATGHWQLSAGEQTHHEHSPAPIQANSPELLLRLARAGAGIAALPDQFAAPQLTRGELRRVLPDWSLPAQTAWAVFPGRRLLPAKTRAFLEMLQAAL
ncbi:LysR family transcriptional regulator [Thiohalocapsa marina]|uniref:LysR family transcriptional regulator n=1 Tax=Thiohalocapsa marina TaxID=424902 RepID=A0A5M8FIL2_9GAMM|nr:LysR substrate-binding domain-containing protein [Thiohalocapsa marina]KAA6184529.1 LysR family transcriptional regulator [Thiohalocapsa marina]